MRLVAFEPLPKLIYPYYTFNAEGYDLLGANILQPTIYSRSLSLHSARLGKYLLSKLVFATNEFKEDLLRWAWVDIISLENTSYFPLCYVSEKKNGTFQRAIYS